MKVGELTKGEPITAAVHESAGAAWERMHERRVAYLVVVRDGRVVGVLSRQDLAGPSGGVHRRMGRTVGDLMRRDVATVTPQTSLRRAASLMRRQGIGCLPVLRAGKLVGLLTVSHLLEILERSGL